MGIWSDVPLTRFENRPTMLAAIESNPLFIAIDMARSVVLYGIAPPSLQWRAMIVWASASFAIGLLFFWKAEESYGHT